MLPKGLHGHYHLHFISAKRSDPHPLIIYSDIPYDKTHSKIFTRMSPGACLATPPSLIKRLNVLFMFCVCVLIHIWTKGEVGAPWNLFKPSSKIFTDRFKPVLLLLIFYVNSVLHLLCFCARLFIDALWSPAGKGLASWLSFVMSHCEVVTFPLVSWVRCGSGLYRFLIFALFLTFNIY